MKLKGQTGMITDKLIFHTRNLKSKTGGLQTLVSSLILVSQCFGTLTPNMCTFVII